MSTAGPREVTPVGQELGDGASVRLSMKTALSSLRSPWSKIERKSEWLVAKPGTSTCVCRRAVAAPYGVPAASAGDMVARPPALIVTGLPPESAAKSSGAVMAEPDVVQVVLSISATKASLKALVTRDGYSCDRKRKS